MTARRSLVVALVVVALVLLVGRALASVYVAYLWFDAVGAASLWRVETGIVLGLRIVSALLASLFVFANLYAVRRSVVSLILPRRVANVEIGEEVPGRYLVGAAAGLSLAMGAFLTLPQESWLSFFLSRSGVPFGDIDPYFASDVSYFVYWLPFEASVFHWAVVTALATTAVVIFLYALTPSVEWRRGSLYVSNYVRRHLTALTAVLLLLLAWHYRLDALGSLLSGSGPNGTFTYTDLHASIQLNIALSIIALATALVVSVFGWVGQVRVVFITIGIVFVLAVGLRQAVPPLVRHAALAPGPDTLDQPYREMQAAYARRAYAVDHIAAADSALAFVSLHAAAPAVSAWDPGALARSISRAGDTSAAAGIGWTAAPNGLLATVAEHPLTGAVPGGRTGSWSVARVRAWTADADGAPEIDGVGTRTLDGVIVSDSAAGYLLVADPFGRIAAPSLTSRASRLAHAWALQNFRLLLEPLPGPVPRIVTHRAVRERVAAIAPFFQQGSTVIPIVAGDTLYWSVDLYATSATYPLSEHVMLDGDDVTYARHAATAVVNAQSGRVVVVADGAPGPIARSWMRAFPALFTTWASEPPAVLAGIAPAIDGARAQAAVVARVGLRGDVPPRGRLPWNEGADTVLATDAEPVFALPGRLGRTAWAAPVLDDNDRVTGMLLASGGAGRTTYWLPVRPGSEARWAGVLDDLRHALDSTAAVPRAARTVRGRVRAIPVGDGIAFIQPAYAWRADDPPALARVAVLMNDSLMTGRTMAEATSLPGPVAAQGDTTAGISLRDFRTQVASLYAAMRTALQHGDWAAFGRAYDALGALLAKPRR